MQKKEKIKNKNYKQFLEEGIITLLEPHHIEKAFENINSDKRIKSKKEARSLLITLYYTGARPNEVVRITAKDIQKEGQYLTIKVPASKKGLPRKLTIPMKKPFVKELYEYSRCFMPDIYIFYDYKSKYLRIKKNKKGELKTYVEISTRLRHHIIKWFNGVIEGSIPPYFLRHSRFSQLMEAGSSAEEVRIWKGAKTLDSVMPYLHMSSKTTKKLGSKLK